MRGVEQVPWFYDVFMSLQERGGLGRWRRWLVAGARGRTLDLGAGTGRNLPLFDPAVRVVAVEPDRGMLRAARARAPSVPAVVASAEALPFHDGSFETVVSSLVFCSVPNPGRGLGEVCRVLADAGQLRMIEHVRSRSALGAWLQDLVQPAWTRVSGGCHPNRDTEAAVEAAGFVIEPEGRRARRAMRRFSARPARREGA